MTVTLQNQALTVKIESFGAQLKSMVTADGTEYLWQGDQENWGDRAPNLFPTVGQLRGQKATCARGEIRLPIHGFACTSEFVVESASDTAATFLLTDNEETRERYPYRFAFRITYAIEDNRLAVSYAVTNTDADPMPFGVGGHPGINVPLVEGENFEDYAVELEYPETADCPTVDLAAGLIVDGIRNRMLTNEQRFTLRHPLFRGDALIFDNIRSRKIKLFSKKSGRGVEMAFADFPAVALWSTETDAPFVCLEPWVTMATKYSEDDVFEHKWNIQTAAPNETKTYTFTLSMF
ncbi:MAG: aldose 1-epimerase family protein [Clostridia bacterium]|nr:aldose 1-epimerase family protein [Clostridia bacterium]